ncbi:HtaA domain-containing protein [Nocardioides sp. LMS-CY]|uniref:HtaA domain-containing protein n=1 Tax=Nocardioides sp. (strain LMS-CY) TaxID=2840457 RepID=UPI001C0016B1|nr:HtaA domain-containing protein [Nocardioides sp. LMS-CY]QWF21120.1 HtaA domain-containing protein [Nocardioides sp. LMS-CY]
MSQHKRLRGLAFVAAGAVASTALVVGTAPAQSASPSTASAATGSFAWEISEQFDDHLSTHELADGATEDAAGVITFPAVSSVVDPVTGAGTVQYDGAVKGTFVNAGNPFYWVKIEDPAVTVDAAGEGTITALVSAWNAAAMGSAEASTSPARVVVTTFDAATKWSTGSIAATPDWAGVLPADSPQATALGIAAGRPVDGKSFAPTFLGQITSGVRAHFYWTTGSDKKAPAAFTASYANVAKSVTTTATYAKQSVSFAVEGKGFLPTDGNPGDDGVYVGLAPAGGLPATGSQTDMDKFVAAQWVPASAIKANAFSTTLTAGADKLEKGTAYALYTWRAHGHSTTSQDTQTAVSLDWSKLTAKAKVTAKAKKKVTTAKAGKLAVAVKGGSLTPAGKVKVTLKKGKVAKKRSATLKNGKAVVKLPKLQAGKWKVKVAFTSADDVYTNGTKALKLKVKKAKKAKAKK